MRNLSLGRRHLVNAYEVEAGIGVIAGNTVWSMPERLECQVLQKARYINTLTFTFTRADKKIPSTFNGSDVTTYAVPRLADTGHQLYQAITKQEFNRKQSKRLQLKQKQRSINHVAY